MSFFTGNNNFSDEIEDMPKFIIVGIVTSAIIYSLFFLISYIIDRISALANALSWGSNKSFEMDDIDSINSKKDNKK